MNEMPKPTPAHAQLAVLAGVWCGREQIPPSPWDPVGRVANARCENRLALDGFAIVHDYEQEHGGTVCFRGHGVFSYDKHEQCFVLYWFDSMGSSPGVFRGSFDGATLRLTGESSQGQQRATWEFQGDSRYRFRLEVSQDGVAWRTFLEGEYTRMVPPPVPPNAVR
jgi:hypothetical protein